MGRISWSHDHACVGDRGPGRREKRGPAFGLTVAGPPPNLGVMKQARVFFLPLAWLAATAVSPAGITFGPVKGQAGQSVRLVSKAEVMDGKVERKELGSSKNGTIRMLRERELTWTFREPLPDGTRRGMVEVGRIDTHSTIRLDGKDETTADKSPLTGKMFAMSKSPAGDWTFELDGSIPVARVRREIAELKVYLKRQWYPGREVEAGDSWEFDPAWIRTIVHQDLHNAQTIGTMRLRQIRRAIDRETAVIEVTIRSTGSDFRSDGTLAEAKVDLKGTMYVNLRTNLDELLELEGTVVTGTSTATTSNTATLPVKLKVTKKFVRSRMAR